MALSGPKHDFFFLLDHFKCTSQTHIQFQQALTYLQTDDEPDTSIQFTLLHDFDVTLQGPDGQPRQICKTNTSKVAIMKAIEITMQSVPQGGKVVFYFGGHAIEESDQSIISGDGELLSGQEIKSCLNNTLHDSVSVAAIFDACHSGGSMALPYNYEAKWRGIRAKRATRKKQEIPMIQISAARRGQFARSTHFKGGFFGQLTWCLIQYLKSTFVVSGWPQSLCSLINPSSATTDPTIEGLTSYLYKNCDPTGAQSPQISTSHRFAGSIPFF
ncbi:hypothetical protein FRC00_002587 [Tulasnella sp. 408]|nr:hypothetical protein FRC00_002587 [Tulasnella sp. 408]